MRSLIPFDGLFGNTVLDHFFDDDMPTVYQDYTAVPKVDIEDKKDHYEITCDMPGFKKEEIHISYENGILSLGAKKEDRKDADDTEHHYLSLIHISEPTRRSRGLGDVYKRQRQFTVKGIKEEGIKAALKDGILTITLPKEEEKKAEPSRQITID